MRTSLVASTALLAVLVCVQSARAAALTSYDGAAMSPDGGYVADVESVESADESREAPKHLFVRDVASEAAREIPLPCADRDGCSATVPVWSHDSKSIAYVVHASKAKTRQLFLASVSAAAIVPKRLLTFSGTLDGARFSKDDKNLAMLAIPGARKEVGATQAGAAIVGEIGANVDEQRIAVVSLAKPAIVYASPPDLFVYEYDWMPGGDGFVGTAAHGDGDNNWWVARLYRFDASTAAATEIYRPASPQQQLADPRVAPDGSHVAFIAGIMSDFGSTGGDLYTLDLRHAHAVPADVLREAGASELSYRWTCRENALVYTQLRGGDEEIHEVEADGRNDDVTVDRSAAALSAEDGSDVSASCDAVPKLAAIRQTFERPPEIDVFSGRSWRTLTHANAGIASEANARSISWTSDGFDVQGWLLEPKAAAAGGKRAMIVNVHGGPAAAFVPRFIGRGTTRDLLRHGYAVFEPNPRGSFGQGETFAAANVKDFGYGDLRDILSGVDAAEKADPAIDDARLGITGGSYGGFMTMWAVTQTNRFKAAVAGAGIADWISYYGENGIDEWMIPYFGASAYDDPAVYRKSSPIDFINGVRTPTFEYVGERDVECPAPQSQEFWHALAARGVRTSLVIYAGEGHHIREPKNRADVTRRTLAWFDGYLKP